MMTITVIKHALYIFAVFLFVLLFKLNSDLKKENTSLKTTNLVLTEQVQQQKTDIEKVKRSFQHLSELNSNLEKESLTLKSKLNKFEVKSPKMIEKHPKMVENILNKNILEFNNNINNITKY